ncbi:hypothetical protein PAQ31011_00833 [Pandoraea aquatica]|uniref:Uncharacterized protein n=1 Tax=Pandoraea aquatica TaxID=2508290 RepID=A0A5E4SH32_9BURK|nr:hypothetical protein [Pandoraea aquatica]VVD75246.1 hypothetical protein PAQ31011_00833 [Pandoraea aquatica]
MHDLKTVTFDASQWQLVPKELNGAIAEALENARYECTENQDLWDVTLAAAPTPAAQSAGQEAVAFMQGLEAAAKWLEKRAADYADEFGGVDPDTGTLEFGSGPHADIKHETHYEWIECAENIRNIAAPVNGA